MDLNGYFWELTNKMKVTVAEKNNKENSDAAGGKL